jgi:16S rRNA (uracil1498-N3)-methyltransferase
MHRFYLPPEACGGAILTLRDQEARHALQVLRLQQGEQVTVLDGQGGHRLCEVRDTARHRVELEVRQHRSIPPLPYRLTLLQAIPKGKTFDTIVQKATELGAWRIVPLVSERVVTRIEGASARQKVEHWQRTAIEAIKQCGSTWLPQIDPPQPLRQCLERPEREDLSLVASLQSGSDHPRRVLQTFRAQHGRAPQTVAVWIGPEGDFTPAELEAIQSSGAVPVTLGSLVLRADTAALYCLSILSYELQAGLA